MLGSGTILDSDCIKVPLSIWIMFMPNLSQLSERILTQALRIYVLTPQ